MAETELAPEWPRLRRSLQNADGFALYFVFTDWPEQLAAGKAYLEGALRLRTLRLRQVRPESADSLVPQTMEALLADKASPAQPVWIECWRYGQDDDWNRGRQKLLARLNEGRGRLEQEFAAPLILILPPAFPPRTAETAPDLWSVRRLTLYLSRPAAETSVSLPSAEPGTPTPAPEAFERAERRLESWRAQTDPATRSLPDAWGAIEALMDAERFLEAKDVADDALRQSRHFRDEGNTQTLWNLFVSLGHAGRVSVSLADWEDARNCFEEAVSLARQLRSVLGDTHQTIRDLSIALDDLGESLAGVGRLIEAQALCEESLGLRRKLLSVVGGNPMMLRDLSVALEKSGDLSWSLGDLDAAHKYYAECAEYRLMVRSLTGTNSETLRDLSVVFSRLGDVFRAKGDLERARLAYSDSVSYGRDFTLLQKDADTSLQALAVPLHRLGDIYLLVGDTQRSEGAYTESLTLNNRRKAAVGGTPGILWDLAGVNFALGKLALANGGASSPGKARHHLLEAEKLLSEAISRYGSSNSFSHALQSVQEYLALVSRNADDACA